MEIRHYKLPFRRPFRAGGTEYTHRSGAILSTEFQGVMIAAEAAPLPGFSRDSMAEVISWLREHRERISNLLEEPVPAESLPLLYDQLNTPPSLRFALDGLVLQQKSILTGQPIHALLSDSPSASQPAVECNATVSITDAEQTLEAVSRYVEQGFGTIKFKIGHQTEHEIALIGEIASRYPDLSIRLDANRAYDLHIAKEMLPLFEQSNLEYCEEPLSEANLNRLPELAELLPFPLAADESIRTLADAARVINEGWAKVLVLKPMMIGSIDTLREIVNLARAADIKLVFTSSLESGLGRYLTAHLAWGLLGEGHRPQGLATGHLLAEDLATLPGSAHTITPPNEPWSPDTIALGLDHPALELL